MPDVAGRIATLSQLVALAPGDVVGLGCVDGAAAEVAFGAVVSVTLRGAPPLRGWALPHR
ncbi:MAG TPA: hypothetical protein ENK23_04820 [Sorangium sp.]|nr:hypothetical protein [Sorangium sp.]